jgi:hypothetical protein
MCFVEDEGGVGKMQSACILTVNVWHDEEGTDDLKRGSDERI